MLRLRNLPWVRPELLINYCFLFCLRYGRESPAGISSIRSRRIDREVRALRTFSLSSLLLASFSQGPTALRFYRLVPTNQRHSPNKWRVPIEKQGIKRPKVAGLRQPIIFPFMPSYKNITLRGSLILGLKCCVKLAG
jgi:hypothetical protein